MRGGATGAHGATGATGGLVVALVVDGVVGIVVVGGGETGVVVDVAAIDIRERVWRINLHISKYMIIYIYIYFSTQLTKKYSRAMCLKSR